MTIELDQEIKQLEKELEMLQLGEEGNKQKIKEIKEQKIKEQKIKEQKIKEIKHLQKIKETQRQIKESPSAYVPVVPVSSEIVYAPFDLYYARPRNINGQYYRFIGMMDGEYCVYKRISEPFSGLSNTARLI